MDYQESVIRGGQTEFMFFAALQADIRSMPDWYLGVRRATGLEDSEGIDAFVSLDAGEVKVQIKTSHTGKRDYEESHYGNGVLVIVLQARSSVQYAQRKILNLLYRQRGAMLDKLRGAAKRARR